ncbi:hypothetical protein LPB140_03075 [Sphingorhabdus lutea]|uniref:Outer membrane lipoprotein-sorting protein n=1 Tax=Sphingorhabdus lutea TaxID=1913578 RepID=A0A1L3JA83_9SPHN|nr:DUF6607 family protein [Sphingorhabdus lutea]APG61973.1 hypothetical protein LPB140_03075 [Sphingorhabdus lutea]
MLHSKFTLSTALFAIALAASPALAHPPIAERPAAQEKASFEADRADILAMAGNYKVQFDMQESTPWIADYTPLDKKTSGGHEVVRVIEDSGRKIVLQHLLVAEAEGKSFVIKHWRQDWEYEPAAILTYNDSGIWKMEQVSEKQRRGRWSQTVYQVDDSPRYAGIGEWEEQGGTRRWRSNWTWRPLARRDAVRSPIYDRYYAINRHSPTPNGWIHFQDNIKMMKKDGKLSPVVSEYVLNSYTKFDEYDVQAADDYMAKTGEYWAAVRGAWADIAAKGGIAIEEEAQTGTIISGQLFTMGSDIVSGKISTEDAIEKAKNLIAQHASVPVATK